MSDVPLSPELESPFETAQRHLDELMLWADAHDADGRRNEAGTRLHLIDQLLTNCLRWALEDIKVEEPHGRTYADYLLGRIGTSVIVEAKREGVYFELPAGFDSRFAKLETLKAVSPEIAPAIDQAMSYCLTRGVPIGVVANGHQLIAFIGSRQDGVPPSEGRAVVFSSLHDMRSSFRELWDYLSKPGVEGRHLYARLQSPSQPAPPEKLAARTQGYPGHKIRNQLQSELQILGGLFLEDLAQDPALSREFLEDAYCQSGALSQYALLTKEILQTRYNAFFAEAGDVTQQPVTDNKGLAKDFISGVLAQSLTRRPIILLGDVGVGKTMFIRRLIGVDARELFERAITLYVDFGSSPALATEVEAFTRRAFVEQLRDDYGIDIYERNFVRGVHHVAIERFSRGIYSDLREEDPGEYKRRELEMLEGLLRSTEAHLRHSLEHISKGQKRQIVVFLDNVDQRPLAFQEQVFLIAQSLATTWPVTAFVTLRPETFYTSRSRGSLAAYQPRVFTVAPPRIDLVLLRRLEFAQRQLKKTGRVRALGSDVTFESHSLDAYIQALIHSLGANRDLIELIDNLSGGNVRQALNFLTAFVGSGHVDSDKIIRAIEGSGRYTVAVHEFLRAIIYGDHQHYDPDSSPIANAFDISTPDPREHFLMLLLVSFIQRIGETGGNEGFVDTAAVFDEGQRLGFEPAQIHQTLDHALDKRLIEANLRGLAFGQPDRYRITAAGAYTTQRLVRQFTYLDAMVVDTPITDPDTRTRIRVVWPIGDRLARGDTFRRYLDGAWEGVADLEPSFGWRQASADLDADIERIALRAAPDVRDEAISS